MAEFKQYSTKNKVTTQANFDSLDKSTFSIGEQYSIVGPLEKDDLSTDIQNSLTKADNAFAAPTNDSTATAGQVLTKTAEGSEWKDAVSGDVTAAGNNTFTGSNIFNGVTQLKNPIVQKTLDISPVYSPDAEGTAPYAKYGVSNITVKDSDVTGSDAVKTLTFPTEKSGTFALTSDLSTVIKKPYGGTPTFTTDEMSQIINNFRNTIICLQYTSAFNGDYYLYPDSQQDLNTCVFVSQGSRSFAGPPGQGIIQLAITKAPDGTGTGTISLKAAATLDDITKVIELPLASFEELENPTSSTSVIVASTADIKAIKDSYNKTLIKLYYKSGSVTSSILLFPQSDIHSSATDTTPKPKYASVPGADGSYWYVELTYYTAPSIYFSGTLKKGDAGGSGGIFNGGIVSGSTGFSENLYVGTVSFNLDGSVIIPDPAFVKIGKDGTIQLTNASGKTIVWSYIGFQKTDSNTGYDYGLKIPNKTPTSNNQVFTLATLDDIKITEATLDGTTLNLTLG